MQARVQYEVPGLVEGDLAEAPLEQFAAWFRSAAEAGVPEPNAMSLATCGPGGPQVRVVLAKEVAADGIRFFTNLLSAKARDLRHDPRAAVVFAWIKQHRQVRFTGDTVLLPRDECAQYFATRPRGAQVGAWASHQSAPLESRDALRAAAAEVERRYPAGAPIPLPDHWGGYLIRPAKVEFWQGQPSRLHDRIRYTARSGAARLDDPTAWTAQRLSP
jgi:pyridoxamine 5'-phosphate oxidase